LKELPISSGVPVPGKMDSIAPPNISLEMHGRSGMDITSAWILLLLGDSGGSDRI
jgi:hypothetical protein